MTYKQELKLLRTCDGVTVPWAEVNGGLFRASAEDDKSSSIFLMILDHQTTHM